MAQAAELGNYFFSLQSKGTLSDLIKDTVGGIKEAAVK